MMLKFNTVRDYQQIICSNEDQLKKKKKIKWIYCFSGSDLLFKAF